jgi:phage terminase small subunit
LEKPESIEYMRELIERNAKKGYASLDAAKSFLTRVMEGKEKDQFGLDASLSDRIKAAEDIIRCEGGFTDKTEVSMNVNFADMLKAARERATNRQIPEKSSPEIIDVTPVGDT